MPWVFKDGDYYYMTAQGPYFAREVYIYRSKTPYGPFGEKRLLFVLPGELDKLGPTAYHWLYMVNLHPALSRLLPSVLLPCVRLEESVRR